VYYIVWRFRAAEARVGAFEAAHGNDGDWARLFGRAAGYRGTALLRTAEAARSYLTIDRWESAGAWDAFKERCAAEYAALDAACAELIEEEERVGAFSEVGARSPTEAAGAGVGGESATPRPYGEWRSGAADREEDAAYAFGHDLMRRCRAAALQTAASSVDEVRAAVEQAVDTALHNVVDLLEGFWRSTAGPDHSVDYALRVVVRDRDGDLRESVDISPARIDLPIGYWKWRDGEFR
jgi:heme-degrading monooxygenase HmoA